MQQLEKKLIKGFTLLEILVVLSIIAIISTVAYQPFQDWRKDREYEETVSSKKELGGGVLNELSHDLDLAKYIFDDYNFHDLNLSKNNEITVILSSDFSFFRVSLSTLFAGLILCFLTISLGEYLSPPMERLADQLRTKNKYNLESIGESKGFWVKEENKIINDKEC